MMKNVKGNYEERKIYCPYVLICKKSYLCKKVYYKKKIIYKKGLSFPICFTPWFL